MLFFGVVLKQLNRLQPLLDHFNTNRFLLFIITYTSTNYTKLKKVKTYVKLFTHKN